MGLRDGGETLSFSPKSLFPFLAALKPFETGRDALNASGVSVRFVQADSACELFDVDRREDLRHGLDRDGCVLIQ